MAKPVGEDSLESLPISNSLGRCRGNGENLTSISSGLQGGGEGLRKRSSTRSSLHHPCQAPNLMHAVTVLAMPTINFRDYSIDPLIIFLKLNLFRNCFTKTHILFKKKASIDPLAISRINFRQDPCR